MRADKTRAGGDRVGRGWLYVIPWRHSQAVSKIIIIEEARGRKLRDTTQQDRDLDRDRPGEELIKINSQEKVVR